MFDGFSEHYLPTGCGILFARVGGCGPPVLPPHGNPQPQLMWRAAAARPASRLSGAAADLPGYGALFRSAAAPDQVPYSKQAGAVDLVPVISAAEFESFAVVPHNRGSRDGYLLALGHRGRLTALTVLDLAPPGEVGAPAEVARLTLGYRHWGLRRSTSAAAGTLHQCRYRRVLDCPRPSARAQRRPGRYPAEVTSVNTRLLGDLVTVQAIYEDCRADAGIDRDHDDADLGRHWISWPVRVSSAYGALTRSYGEVPGVWRPWARRVARQPMPVKHFAAEDQPGQTADVLTQFTGST